MQWGRPGFDLWDGKIPWRKKWQPTPVFLPKESHGQRSLVGYSPWGNKELDTTEQRTLTGVWYILSSVAQSCLTLCDPMDCGTPGLPVHHQLLQLTKTHVHWVSDAIQPSHPLLSPSPPAFNLAPSLGSFPMSQFFASGGQSIGVSASTSVLSMNIRDWFPLGWTGWISLQSKGLSRKSLLQPRCPSADEWIRKLWYIYTIEYYSAIKKNSFESILMRWMKLEPIIQSEVSQKDKDHYNILIHIYGI